MDPNIQQPPVQQTPSSPPVPEPPKTFGWIKWVLIVLAVSVLSSGTTYFVLQSQSQNQTPQPVVQTPPTVTPTPDPTANWETYSDLERGFSFKYPPNFKVEKRADNFYAIVPVDIVVEPLAGIMIDARPRFKVEDFSKAINNYRNNLSNIKEETLNNGVKISGIIGISESSKETTGDLKQGEGMTNTVVILKGKQDIIIIDYLHTATEYIPPSLFDHILSTFKFL